MPHAWLARNGAPVATHHLVAPDRFLLLAGADGEAWCAAAEGVARERGVPLGAYRVAPDGDLRDDDGTWKELRGHGDAGAVLIRPDGHVAFRAAAAPVNPAEELASALDVALRTGAQRPTTLAIPG
jgi:2,4-dichlorophenol 6-monooxygenase